MAVTQEQIDTWKLRLEVLNQMISDGVRQVTHRDQTITYNTTDSLIRARDDLTGQIARAEARLSAASRPRQTQLVYAGRGYQ